MDIKKTVANTGKVIVAGGTGAVGGDWKTAVAAALGESLSIGIDKAFADMSKKRARQLFDNAEFVGRIIEEIKSSDDYASLVLDIWKRYNFESSENRRKFLKSILQKATYEKDRNYENFSKILLVAQQITGIELVVLQAFYMQGAYTYSDNPHGSSNDSFQLNVHEMDRLFKDRRLNNDALPELAQALTQLGNYGLIAERPATLGGPFYTPLRFGKMFLGYIEN